MKVLLVLVPLALVAVIGCRGSQLHLGVSQPFGDSGSTSFESTNSNTFSEEYGEDVEGGGTSSFNQTHRAPTWVHVGVTIPIGPPPRAEVVVLPAVHDQEPPSFVEEHEHVGDSAGKDAIDISLGAGAVTALVGAVLLWLKYRAVSEE